MTITSPQHLKDNRFINKKYEGLEKYSKIALIHILIVERSIFNLIVKKDKQ